MPGDKCRADVRVNRVGDEHFWTPSKFHSIPSCCKAASVSFPQCGALVMRGAIHEVACR